MGACASRLRRNERAARRGLLLLGIAASLWLTCPAAAAHSREHCEKLIHAAMEANTAGDHAGELNIYRDIEVGCPPYLGQSVAILAIKQQAALHMILKEPRQALTQAERCLRKDADAGCMFLQGRALLDLGQQDEGLRFVSWAINQWQGEIARLRLDPPSDMRDLQIAQMESSLANATHYLKAR